MFLTTRLANSNIFVKGYQCTTGLIWYAVIRYVPDIEREVFVNVGLVMMCKRRRWMRVDIDVDCKRIGCISSIHSYDEIARQLSTFTSISAGEKHAGPIAVLPVEGVSDGLLL